MDWRLRATTLEPCSTATARTNSKHRYKPPNTAGKWSSYSVNWRPIAARKELIRREAALERRRGERAILIGGFVALLISAAAGWGVVLVKRRSHRTLMDSFGALQAANAELVSREAELRSAISRIKRLEGLLPICAECKSIRDADGQWHAMESYISDRSEARFSHGYCPTCLAKAMGQA